MGLAAGAGAAVGSVGGISSTFGVVVHDLYVFVREKILSFVSKIPRWVLFAVVAVVVRWLFGNVFTFFGRGISRLLRFVADWLSPISLGWDDETVKAVSEENKSELASVLRGVADVEDLVLDELDIPNISEGGVSIDSVQIGGPTACAALAAVLLVLTPPQYRLKGSAVLAVKAVTGLAIGFDTIGGGINWLIAHLPAKYQEYAVSAGLFRPVGRFSKEYTRSVNLFGHLSKKIRSSTADEEEEREFVKVYKELEEGLLEEISIEDGAAMAYLKTLLSEMREHSSRLSTKYKERPRVVPPALWVDGESQIGKTRCVSDMITLLCNGHAVEHAAYTRLVNLEFMEGWKKHQKIVFYEDIDKGLKEYLLRATGELTHIINNAPFEPTFAFGRKGEYYEPQQVFVTANRPFTAKIEGHGDMLSFQNRFMAYKMFIQDVEYEGKLYKCVKPDGGLDSDVVSARDFPSALTNTHAWIYFRPYIKNAQGQFVLMNVKMTFEQVFRRFVAQYVLNVEKRNRQVRTAQELVAWYRQRNIDGLDAVVKEDYDGPDFKVADDPAFLQEAKDEVQMFVSPSVVGRSLRTQNLVDYFWNAFPKNVRASYMREPLRGASRRDKMNFFNENYPRVYYVLVGAHIRTENYALSYRDNYASINTVLAFLTPQQMALIPVGSIENIQTFHRLYAHREVPENAIHRVMVHRDGWDADADDGEDHKLREGEFVVPIPPLVNMGLTDEVRLEAEQKLMEVETLLLFEQDGVFVDRLAEEMEQYHEGVVSIMRAPDSVVNGIVNYFESRRRHVVERVAWVRASMPTSFSQWFASQYRAFCNKHPNMEIALIVVREVLVYVAATAAIGYACGWVLGGGGTRLFCSTTAAGYRHAGGKVKSKDVVQKVYHRGGKRKWMEQTDEDTPHRGGRRGRSRREAKSTAHHRALHSNVQMVMEETLSGSLADELLEEEEEYLRSRAGVEQTRAVLKKITENCVRVARRRGGHNFELQGIFVKDNKLLMPLHFFMVNGEVDAPEKDGMLREGSMVVLKFGSKTLSFPFTRANMYRPDSEGVRVPGGKAIINVQQDWCIISVPLAPEKMPSFKDITKYFMDMYGADDLDFPTYMLLRVGRVKTLESIWLPGVSLEEEAHSYSSIDDAKRIDLYVPRQLIYQEVVNGDCGSPIVACNGVGRVVILGFHVLRRQYPEETYSVGIPILRGYFDEMDLIVEQKDEIQGGVTLDLGEGYEYLGVCDIPRGCITSKTKYVKSPIADRPFLADVTRQPALLGAIDDARSELSAIELMMKELKRSSRPVVTHPYALDDVMEIKQAIFEDYDTKWTDEYIMDTLTDQEVLSGNHDPKGRFKHLQAATLSTASGHPFDRWVGARGKKHLVRGVAGAYEYVADFKKMLDESRERLLNGDTSEIFFVVCYLKDELRSFKKIVAECTRVIQCFPFHHVCLMKEFYGAFVNFVHGSFPRMFSAVGMSVSSEDWHNMILYLTQIGSTGFDGDFEKFEQWLCEQILDLCVDVVNMMYKKRMVNWDPQHDFVRRALAEHIVNTHLIVGDFVFKKFGDLKSGAYGTTVVFGNIMLQFFMRLAWKHIMLDMRPSLAGQMYYDRFVRAKGYGDDNINVLSEQIREQYNFVTVSAYFKTLGINYTPANKEALAPPPYVEVCELMFLKMRTRDMGHEQRFPGLTYGPVPDYEDLLPTLKYISRTLAPMEALVNNMNDVLKRAWCWDRNKWEAFRESLKGELEAVQIRSTLISWNGCWAMWKAGDISGELDTTDVLYDFVEWSPRPKQKDPRGNAMYNVIVPVGRFTQAIGRIPPGGSVIQMEVSGDPMAADPLVDPEVKAPVTELLPATGTRPTVKQISDVNMVDLIKRFALRYHNSLPSEWFVHDPFVCSPGSGFKSGWMCYFAQLYRYWWGDTRYILSGGSNDTAWLAYVTEALGDQQLTTDELFTGAAPIAGVAGGGPATIRSQPDINGKYVFQVPCVSIYKMLLTPIEINTDSTTTLEGTTPGRIRFNSSGTEDMYVAGGDNLRFGYLLQVPRLKVALHADGEKKLANRRLRSNVQMDHRGIHFEESEVVKGRVGGGRTPLDVKTDNVERPQDFVAFAERYQYLQNVDWSDSMIVNQELWAAAVPFGLLGNVNRAGFNNFVYWQGGVTVRVELQSQPFQQGQLILYYVPQMSLSNCAKHINTSRTSQTVLPMVKFTAGGARSVELFVPFVNVRNKIFTDYPNEGILNQMGSFHLQVFNPLQVGADAVQTSATLAIFVSYPKAAFEVIKFGASGIQWDRQLSALFQAEKRVDFVVVEEEKEKGRRVKVSVRRENGLRSKVQGGVLGTAANVLAIANDTVDFASKVSRKGKALRGKDLDYPNTGANPIPVMDIGQIDIANGTSQVSVARYLDIAPSRHDILTHVDVATSDDEMDIHALAARPTFFETFEWKDTDEEGKDIYTGHLTIAPGIFGAAINSFFQPTLMEYVVLPFNFWRGTLVYTFEVIATQYHSGRLAFLPRLGSPTDATDVSNAYDQYGGTMDISAKNNVFDFRVQMQASTGMLRVPHEIGWDSIIDYFSKSMGTFGIYVLTPLQVGGVSASIQINVYLSVEDLEYDMPGFGLTRVIVEDPYVGDKGQDEAAQAKLREAMAAHQRLK
jgi:hypothetical protein